MPRRIDWDVFDAIWEGGGLWFSVVKEPRAELPYTWHEVGGHCLCLKGLAPLFIWRTIRGVFRPQESEVHFYTAGPQHEATQVDGVSEGL